MQNLSMREMKFLEDVRERSDIGYERMLQIIKFEWSESNPARAAMEFPTMPYKHLSLAQMMAAKQADPLAGQWEVFDEISLDREGELCSPSA